MFIPKIHCTRDLIRKIIPQNNLMLRLSVLFLALGYIKKVKAKFSVELAIDYCRDGKSGGN